MWGFPGNLGTFCTLMGKFLGDLRHSQVMLFAAVEFCTFLLQRDACWGLHQSFTWDSGALPHWPCRIAVEQTFSQMTTHFAAPKHVALSQPCPAVPPDYPHYYSAFMANPPLPPNTLPMAG
mmetsp:Transcript_17863/g.28324  ORF Transcript_17863/g.28324 Transcript_17863/m.28324 type:complete len:121 (-) Transcript_17863:589-951(-)